MSKSTILNYSKQAAIAQVNSDRVAFFLELNKPRKYSKKELSIELNLTNPEISQALKTHPKIEVSGDNPLKYSWEIEISPKSTQFSCKNTKPKAEKLKDIITRGDRDYSTPKPREQLNLNPLCPDCENKSHKKGKNRFGKQRYICTFCRTKFSESTGIKQPVSAELLIQAEPIKAVNNDELEKLLNQCRHKTFYAVRKFRNGVISEAIAKKIAKNAFPDISSLPKSRSIVHSARLLATRVRRAASVVGAPSITEAIAHLISYIAFPDGED